MRDWWKMVYSVVDENTNKSINKSFSVPLKVAVAALCEIGTEDRLDAEDAYQWLKKHHSDINELRAFNPGLPPVKDMKKYAQYLDQNYEMKDKANQAVVGPQHQGHSHLAFFHNYSDSHSNPYQQGNNYRPQPQFPPYQPPSQPNPQPNSQPSLFLLNNQPQPPLFGNQHIVSTTSTFQPSTGFQTVPQSKETTVRENVSYQSGNSTFKQTTSTFEAPSSFNAPKYLPPAPVGGAFTSSNGNMSDFLKKLDEQLMLSRQNNQ